MHPGTRSVHYSLPWNYAKVIIHGAVSALWKIVGFAKQFVWNRVKLMYIYIYIYANLHDQWEHYGWVNRHVPSPKNIIEYQFLWQADGIRKWNGTNLLLSYILKQTITCIGTGTVSTLHAPSH